MCAADCMCNAACVMPQAMLVTKYLYEEFKQYHYFSLAPAPPIALPEDPQSTDILQLQQSLEVAYTQEISKQATAGQSAGWIYIEVNASAEPRTIAALAAKGSTSVVLPIPLRNVTDSATNITSLVADTQYYNVRLFDVGVYPLDSHGDVLGGPRSVRVTVAKKGLSSFFDADMKLHTFSHAPVVYGAGGEFSYQIRPGGFACPVASRGCGALCPEFIRYSPYGTWNVEIDGSEGVDMTQLRALRFEFQVTYQKNNQPDLGRDFFGKHYPKYMQDEGGGPPDRGCFRGEITALDA